MSVDENHFVGPYLRVWPPIESVRETIQSCPKENCPQHGKRVWTKCCAECGSPILDVGFPCERQLDLYEFFRSRFANGDLFQRLTETDEKGLVIVLPNRRDQGGSHLDEGVETEIKDYMSCFDFPDWVKVIEAFDSCNIKYEKRQGILHWYN